MDWSLLPAYLLLGAPAWVLALAYTAFRLLPKKKSMLVSSIRIVLVAAAVILLAVFVTFVVMFDGH